MNTIFNDYNVGGMIGAAFVLICYKYFSWFFEPFWFYPIGLIIVAFIIFYRTEKMKQKAEEKSD